MICLVTTFYEGSKGVLQGMVGAQYDRHYEVNSQLKVVCFTNLNPD